MVKILISFHLDRVQSLPLPFNLQFSECQSDGPADGQFFNSVRLGQLQAHTLKRVPVHVFSTQLCLKRGRTTAQLLILIGEAASRSAKNFCELIVIEDIKKP